MNAVECKSFDELEEAGKGAVYFISETCLVNNCPGCGRRCALTIGGDKSPRWNVDQRDPLTLTPSVNCVGCCGWHGFLKNGEWVSC